MTNFVFFSVDVAHAEEVIEFSAYEKTFQYNSGLFARSNLCIKIGEEIIKSQEMFMGSSINYIREKIKNLKSSEDILDAFNESAFEITRSLELLNTERKLRTFAKQRDLLEEPTYFTIDENVIQKFGEFEEEKATGCLMPIEHQIKQFLQCPGILDSILTTQNSGSTRIFRNRWVDLERCSHALQ